ncbi:MAG TPA: TetR/AcrR family transcriptional regulator [Rhizomicrobium sp.]|nr:TetR/AcrR family transcriptional regulator [Rhizomicrobium sp.]
MRAKRRKPQSRKPDETRKRLLDAAETAFNFLGFDGTDTNRIARAAGFAPQTFYRHFEDKTDIFLAVYDRWWRDEGTAVAKTIAAGGRAEDIARVVIRFHARWRVFRRSLRHLAVSDARVRVARASARLEQLQALKRIPGAKHRSDAELSAALLSLERLCDAAAEREFTDLGISVADTHKMIAAAVRVTHGARSRKSAQRNRH